MDARTALSSRVFSVTGPKLCNVHCPSRFLNNSQFLYVAVSRFLFGLLRYCRFLSLFTDDLSLPLPVGMIYVSSSASSSSFSSLYLILISLSILLSCSLSLALILTYSLIHSFIYFAHSTARYKKQSTTPNWINIIGLLFPAGVKTKATITPL